MGILYVPLSLQNFSLIYSLEGSHYLFVMHSNMHSKGYSNQTQ